MDAGKMECVNICALIIYICLSVQKASRALADYQNILFPSQIRNVLKRSSLKKIHTRDTYMLPLRTKSKRKKKMELPIYYKNESLLICRVMITKLLHKALHRINNKTATESSAFPTIKQFLSQNHYSVILYQ